MGAMFGKRKRKIAWLLLALALTSQFAVSCGAKDGKVMTQRKGRRFHKGCRYRNRHGKRKRHGKGLSGKSDRSIIHIYRTGWSGENLDSF